MPQVGSEFCGEILKVYELCLSKTSYTHQTLDELSKSVDDCAKEHTLDQLVFLSRRWNAMVPSRHSVFDSAHLNTVDSIPDSIPSDVENRTSYLKGEREALCRDALQVGAVKPGGDELDSRGRLKARQFIWQLRGTATPKRSYS